MEEAEGEEERRQRGREEKERTNGSVRWRRGLQRSLEARSCSAGDLVVAVLLGEAVDLGEWI